MSSLRALLLIFVFVVFFTSSVFSQRKYQENTNAIGLAIGSKVSGQKLSPHVAISYDIYKGWNSILSSSLNYLSNNFNIKTQDQVLKEKQPIVFGDFQYKKMLFKDHSESFYINVGLGGMIGYEFAPKLGKYKEMNISFDKTYKDKFLAGGVGQVEIEWFALSRISFVLSAKQLYSPLSNFDKWHTIASVGAKIVLE